MFGRVAGHDDVNDAEPRCSDLAMRWVVGDRAIQNGWSAALRQGRLTNSETVEARQLLLLPLLLTRIHAEESLLRTQFGGVMGIPFPV